MRRPGKKRSLLSNWEGSYFFVEYKDGKGISRTRSWQHNVYSQRSQWTMLGTIKEGFAIEFVCKLIHDL
jgi:hypothetical protein